jgi:predicted DNA-binding transcriptional regulator AlpA
MEGSHIYIYVSRRSFPESVELARGEIVERESD